MFRFLGLDKGDMWKKSIKMLEYKYGYNEAHVAVLVSIVDQKMYVIAGNEIKRIFLVSTSRYGYSSRKIEDKTTPLGVFKIDALSRDWIKIQGVEGKLLSKTLLIRPTEDDAILGKRETEGSDILLSVKDYEVLCSFVKNNTIVNIQL
ncbi:MAG: L,D-transpeptidase [Candidatus Omnitrophica bacterium]|nr:L,D-transpeptidase [Candidatus Omnitrophota bacterium]